MFSSFLYAVYAVLIKYIFIQIDFWNGIIWISLGTVVSALLLLVSSSFRRKIKEAFQNSSTRIKSLLIGDQVLSFLGKILYSLAVSMASVAMVESLTSIQPVLVFVISIFLSLKFKNILEERLDIKNMLAKSGGILLVVVGVLLLYI
jgi:uncharacterized membrane protein